MGNCLEPHDRQEKRKSKANKKHKSGSLKKPEGPTEAETAPTPEVEAKPNKQHQGGNLEEIQKQEEPTAVDTAPKSKVELKQNKKKLSKKQKKQEENIELDTFPTHAVESLVEKIELIADYLKKSLEELKSENEIVRKEVQHLKELYKNNNEEHILRFNTFEENLKEIVNVNGKIIVLPDAVKALTEENLKQAKKFDELLTIVLSFTKQNESKGTKKFDEAETGHTFPSLDDPKVYSSGPNYKNLEATKKFDGVKIGQSLDKPKINSSGPYEKTLEQEKKFDEVKTDHTFPNLDKAKICCSDLYEEILKGTTKFDEVETGHTFSNQNGSARHSYGPSESLARTTKFDESKTGHTFPKQNKTDTYLHDVNEKNLKGTGKLDGLETAPTFANQSEPKRSDPSEKNLKRTKKSAELETLHTIPNQDKAKRHSQHAHEKDFKPLGDRMSTSCGDLAPNFTINQDVDLSEVDVESPMDSPPHTNLGPDFTTKQDLEPHQSEVDPKSTRDIPMQSPSHTNLGPSFTTKQDVHLHQGEVAPKPTTDIPLQTTSNGNLGPNFTIKQEVQPQQSEVAPKFQTDVPIQPLEEGHYEEAPFPEFCSESKVPEPTANKPEPNYENTNGEEFQGEHFYEEIPDLEPQITLRNSLIGQSEETFTANAQLDLHTRKSFDLIDDVWHEAAKLKEQVEEFSGTKEDTTYLHLNELLERKIVKLDNIDSEGKLAIRAKRRDVIQYIHKLHADLNDKVK